MFNLLVWLITVACFAVALRATYLVAFERALTALKGKRDQPDDAPVSQANSITQSGDSEDGGRAVAELEDARQCNRHLVREVALLKEELHASQSAVGSLQDRLAAIARREAEVDEEVRLQSAQLELEAMRSAYQNGHDTTEQRQEALRQISEMEGELASLLSEPDLHGRVDRREPIAREPHANGESDELEAMRRQLAERVQVNSEIHGENLRLREAVSALEQRLRDRAAEDHQQVLSAQQSLGAIVAKLQTLTETTIELQHSLMPVNDECMERGRHETSLETGEVKQGSSTEAESSQLFSAEIAK